MSKTFCPSCMKDGLAVLTFRLMYFKNKKYTKLKGNKQICEKCELIFPEKEGEKGHFYDKEVN